MKEVLLVDLFGFITDVTLVDDNISGVFPLYREQAQPAEGEAEHTQPAPELMGYTVAIPVPKGLYKPRFDLSAWEQYNKPLEPELAADGKPKTNESGNIIYKPRSAVKLWTEGLTPEEIEAIRNPPEQPTAEERIATLTAQLKKQEEHSATVSADLQSFMEHLSKQKESRTKLWRIFHL
ncbi:hypothetical protein [Paenibacillus oleatilyticus]|uniref:Bacteriophage SP-beta YorD domain-containing protein n=1 Tax=Paenibacillus oleatilyticus TaxID=2594886 RepID=A0ABV4VB09_9BACL